MRWQVQGWMNDASIIHGGLGELGKNHDRILQNPSRTKHLYSNFTVGRSTSFILGEMATFGFPQPFLTPNRQPRKSWHSGGIWNPRTTPWTTTRGIQAKKSGRWCSSLPKAPDFSDVGAGKTKGTLHGYHLVKLTFLGLLNDFDDFYSHLLIGYL